MTVVDPADTVARALAGFVPQLASNIAGAMEEEPNLQVSLRQLRILEQLQEGAQRTGELAAQSMVSQPTATAAIAPLEARGMVTRSPDPDDGRATLISITAAGAELLRAGHERIHRRLQEMIGEVSKADAAAAIRLEALVSKGLEATRQRRATR